MLMYIEADVPIFGHTRITVDSPRDHTLAAELFSAIPE
jgi:hypothetical protein